MKVEKWRTAIRNQRGTSLRYKRGEGQSGCEHNIVSLRLLVLAREPGRIFLLVVDPRLTRSYGDPGACHRALKANFMIGCMLHVVNHRKLWPIAHHMLGTCFPTTTEFIVILFRASFRIEQLCILSDDLRVRSRYPRIFTHR